MHTFEDFKARLAMEEPDHLATTLLTADAPHVFADDADAPVRLAMQLQNLLGHELDLVAIVGSANTGFSLHPEHPGRPFAANSDIDIAVVSASAFDSIWEPLLKLYYPHCHNRPPLPPDIRSWHGQRRSDVFMGRIDPRKLRPDRPVDSVDIRPLRDISNLWFHAFKSLSVHPAFTARDVSGRLFRTRAHAVRYYSEGLRLARLSLQAEETHPNGL